MLYSGYDAMPPEERINRIMGWYRRQVGADALQSSLAFVLGQASSEMKALANGLEPAWADFAAASVYAALMGRSKRKALGAYFTPPGLVDYLLKRAATFGVDIGNDRIRDPAAGGAAFIVPIAREMVGKWRDAGHSDQEIVDKLSKQLMGREIDPGLAEVANTLLRRCLVKEYGIAEDLVLKLSLIENGDSLAPGHGAQADHEIGNPPFLRLAAKDATVDAHLFDDIAAGRLNLYSVFVRRGLDALGAGGVLAYIIPASFIGGPEFKQFRLRVRQLAEVMAVDIIDGRKAIFSDVTQDTCVLVLKRRATEVVTVEAATAASNTVAGDGGIVSSGMLALPSGDGPWTLPGEGRELRSTLADWGYVARIGYLVANRQPERMHKAAGPRMVPLVWAKSIGQDGVFDHERGASLRGHGWVDAPEGASYIVYTGCVAVQRTSARGQQRRITAAEIPDEFVKAHGGVVAENHVILLIPNKPDAATPADLATMLNSPEVGAQLDRMCGSASIPAKLLAVLPLPSPPTVHQQSLSSHEHESYEVAD